MSEGSFKSTPVQFDTSFSNSTRHQFGVTDGNPNAIHFNPTKAPSRWASYRLTKTGNLCRGLWGDKLFAVQVDVRTQNQDLLLTM
jgi:hypothetical protein